MQITFPMLRADFVVFESYAYLAEPPLNCCIPILVACRITG